MDFNQARRDLLHNSFLIGTTAAASAIIPLEAFGQASKPESQEPEVTATEDLMREHGVIRRALLVYREVVPMLQQNAASVDAAALKQTAQLFRNFGEDYHERLLEEQHIFPVIRKMNNKGLTRYADVLTAQHQRGREITDYILVVTNASKISAAHAEPLAGVLESFVLMYENHAAREDTIVFPAWKTNFSNKQLDELGDEFEDIERKMFGKDGFEDAEHKIAQIEATLGFADLAQFTPPPPPKP